VIHLDDAQSIAGGEGFDYGFPSLSPARGSHSCAIRADSSLVCWGSNIEGFEDQTKPLATLAPKPVGNAKVVQVSVSGFDNCTVLGSGTAQCWGLDVDGALGDGSVGSSTPHALVGVAGLTNVVEVAAGEDSACAALADGSLWCWGDDSVGELGDGHDGEGARSATPVRAKIDHVVHVVAGWASFCAVRDDGHAMCWGVDKSGEVGDGSVTDHVTTPHQVALDGGITSVAANGAHACAIRTDGSLWCWGTNANGGLGIAAATTIQPTPARVALDDVVVEVAIGFHHTCARTMDDSLWCWGMNQSGEVGDGTLVDRDVPVRVVGLPP
jgi:alpha-tubulin suppressor-like RCC1 family protein